MQRVTILCTLLLSCSSKELPSFIEKCEYTEDADVGECIADRMKVLMPKLEKGIPELKLPPVDPLRVPKMVIDTGSGSNVAFSAVLQDIEISGCKDVIVEEFHFDFKTHSSLFHMRLPRLYLAGTYDIKGKVLLFDIQAKGSFTANLTNVDATTKFGFDVIEKDGKKYVNVKTTGLDITTNFDSAVLYFDQLFNQQELNDQVNKVINENVQSLGKEVAPLVHEATHSLVVKLVSPVFDEYSIEDLFIVK
ncbi:hypothetical protein FQR65_LT12348 [Abscondita terminalis]|nr:hypothetical protein FQR65_LT12348 [Abscondita terminalis]